MGWEALGQWGDNAARIEPLTGGVANEVWSVRVDGQLAVARFGSRADADLVWEAELLQHLSREGMTAPVPIPTPTAPESFCISSANPPKSKPSDNGRRDHRRSIEPILAAKRDEHWRGPPLLPQPRTISLGVWEFWKGKLPCS